MNVNQDGDVCMEISEDNDIPDIEGIPCEMEEFRTCLNQRNSSEIQTDRATGFTSNSMSSRNSSGNLSSLVDNFIPEERCISSNSSVATTKASVGSTDVISIPTVHKENKFPNAPPSSPEQAYVVRPSCRFKQAEFGMSPTADLCLPSEFSPPTSATVATGIHRVTARLDSELDNWDLDACGLVYIPEEDERPDGSSPLQINIPRCIGGGDASADEAGSGIEVDDGEEGSIATSLAVEVASLDDDGTYVGYGEEAGSCMHQQQCSSSGGALSECLSDLDCPAAESDASSDMHSGSSRGYTYGKPTEATQYPHMQQQSRRHSQQHVSSNSPPAFRPQRMIRSWSTSPESLPDGNCGASFLCSDAFATFSPDRLGLEELGDEPGLEAERCSSAGASVQRWSMGDQRLTGDGGGDSVSGSRTSTDRSAAKKRGNKHKRNSSSPRRTGTVYRTATARAATRMDHRLDVESVMLNDAHHSAAAAQDCRGKRKREADVMGSPGSFSADSSGHFRDQKAPCINSTSSKHIQSRNSSHSTPISWDTQ